MRACVVVALALLAGANSPCRAWEVTQFKDRMTDRLETQAITRSNGAELVVGCMNGKIDARIRFQRPIGFGRIGVSFRFDDGPVVPRFAYVSPSSGDLYLWPANASDGIAAIRRGKRLRVTIGQAFLDFDLTGTNGIEKIRCAPI